MFEPLRGYRVALVLAGGNALGAYQAGVYEALLERGIEPDWVVGASIGAINGAIIAGNVAADRVARLKAFWRPAAERKGWPMWPDLMPETWRRTTQALGTTMAGRPGLFAPLGSAISGSAFPALYDSSPLPATLAALVNFTSLNAGPMRYTATAVDVDSGEEAAFDTAHEIVTPEHVRASAALPPSFPAVRIGERLFVDGGLSANLPLDPVLGNPSEQPTVCIAVDLLPSAAARPTTMGEVLGRTQDLLFAAQSRRTIARWQAAYADGGPLATRSTALVTLTYGDQGQEVAGKAMDFSGRSVQDRWTSGYRATVRMLERIQLQNTNFGGLGLKIATL